MNATRHVAQDAAERIDAVTLRGLAQAHLALGGHHAVDALVAEIEGPFDPSALAGAVAALAQRYPALACRLVTTPDGVRLEPDPAGVPLSVETGAWREVLARACAAPLGDETPAGHVIAVPSTEGFTLLLLAHHAIVDGRTLSVLLRDLLVALAGTPLGRPWTVRSWIDEVPLPTWLRLARPWLPAAWAWRMRRARAALRPLPRALRAGEPVPAVVEAWVLPVCLMDALRERARREHATVGAALAAAVWEASRYDLGAGRGMPVEAMVDVRPLVPNASLVGLYAGGVAALGAAAPSDAWSRARAARRATQRQIAWRVPLVPHLIAADVPDARGWLRQRGFDLEDGGGLGAASQVSNVGVWDQADAVAPFVVRSLWSFAAPLRGGPARMAWLRTVEGRGCISATGHGLVTCPDRLAGWLGAIEAELVRMVRA